MGQDISLDCLKRRPTTDIVDAVPATSQVGPPGNLDEASRISPDAPKDCGAVEVSLTL